jgi:hypothetical protein
MEDSSLRPAKFSPEERGRRANQLVGNGDGTLDDAFQHFGHAGPRRKRHVTATITAATTEPGSYTTAFHLLTTRTDAEIPHAPRRSKSFCPHRCWHLSQRSRRQLRTRLPGMQCSARMTTSTGLHRSSLHHRVRSGPNHSDQSHVRWIDGRHTQYYYRVRARRRMSRHNRASGRRRRRWMLGLGRH